MPRLLAALLIGVLSGYPALADRSSFCGQADAGVWAFQVEMVASGVPMVARRGVLLNRENP